MSGNPPNATEAICLHTIEEAVEDIRAGKVIKIGRASCRERV